ncbi:hypothetical protein BT67DRAFT_431893 [Trichocladium antarcticum]|uniref:Uncharacterized protein n=1 Tax=Trichocladium antarcticum TaxID=1450529 RepID=A0AAN6ZH35_9PEZI|nr:hypothetical protein BT67DRAFT_431893 [Trichocladium antarcticum]
MAPRDATVDDADAASAEASSCRPAEQKDHSPSPRPTTPTPELPPSSSPTAGPLPEGPPRPGRASFPISFFFHRGKAPSVSLASSTAEGKPVPLTATGALHTSALQKLNSKYPSAVRRHGYTETTGPQSSTYSQPVLVRTYSGPSPSQTSHGTRSSRHRPLSSSRGASRRVPLPSSSTSTDSLAGQLVQPTVSGVGVGTTSCASSGTGRHSAGAHGSVHGVNMPRSHEPKKASSSTGKLLLPWQWNTPREPEEPKLPPLEAFSFKSFMADLQTRGSQHSIGADLDRIAEICARSRYSLSNQYEVHVAPHGSGEAFTAGMAPTPSTALRRRKSQGRNSSVGGPTLQAITSEDEGSARSQPKKRNGGGRRRSAAYNTLETIMSSSRSSEEERPTKKSAAELAGEIRARAARKTWGNPLSASASTGNSNGSSANATPDTEQPPPNSSSSSKTPARKTSASFATAIMDTTTSSSSGSAKSTSTASASHPRPTPSSTSTSTPTALRSNPAQPQTSTSHLGAATAAAARPAVVGLLQQQQQHRHRHQHRHQHRQTAIAAPPPPLRPSVAGGAPWSAWIPSSWGPAPEGGGAGGSARQQQPSHAEGSLRQLLGR